MDVLIRGIDPIYVKEIERKAKEISNKLGRNFSRNEYINMLIQNDCELRLMKLKEDKFDQAVDHLTSTLDRQVAAIQSYVDSTNRLFYLLSSGSDIEEGVDRL